MMRYRFSLQRRLPSLLVLGKSVAAAIIAAAAFVLPAVAAEPVGLIGGNLLRNGDFEWPSSTSPPPGWSMWGAQQDKRPEHFRLDPDAPHAGKAALRLHQPAGSRAYLVSAPESAITPKEGRTYRLSFWARSDRAGEAAAGWTAYRNIKPFVDAPSPGSYAIHVGPEWKSFRFELHEGWDFFADDCRHLMVTFKAGAEPKHSRTLWLDDVTVTEEPSTRAGRLVNPASLRYTALNHRLKPGDSLRVVVDAGKRLHKAPREVGGVSFHRVAGWAGLPFDRQGRYVLPAELEETIRQMRLPMTRFYALGDEPFGLEAAIDKAAEFCRRIGVPQSTVPLEFEIQGATRKLSAEGWARGVRHSLARGYEFRHWEITNEPYVGHAGRAFPTAESYLEHFLAVSRAIREAHPQGRIGLSIYHRSPAWGNYLLKRAAGRYDFVVPHYYSFTNVQRASFEDVVLGGNYRILDEILETAALIAHYNPDGDVTQYDTEWGMHSPGPAGERADLVRRNGNICGMMHRAVRLIHYLREGMLRGASSWEMFTYRRAPGFGFLVKDAPDRRSMTYWLYHQFNRHAGDWVLPIEGTSPYYRGLADGRPASGPMTPVVATLSDDGKRMFLILANGSWETPAPCQIQLQRFGVSGVEAVLLSSDDPDADPQLSSCEEIFRELPISREGERLRATLPPHSVAFITLASS